MIFFDLDGTLLNHHEAERKAALVLARAMSLPSDSDDSFLVRWHAASERYMEMFLAGEIGFEQQRRLRLENVLGGALTTAEANTIFGVYLEAYEANWELYEDVVPCLDRIGQKNRLGIISNGNDAQQRKKLSTLAVDKHFEIVVTSECAGIAKPSSKIFDYACNEANLENNLCVYVGDRLDTDACAANKAGLHGIWLDRSSYSNAVPERVTRICSLDQLKIG